MKKVEMTAGMRQSATELYDGTRGMDAGTREVMADTMALLVSLIKIMVLYQGVDGIPAVTISNINRAISRAIGIVASVRGGPAEVEKMLENPMEYVLEIIDRLFEHNDDMYNMPPIIGNN